MKNRWIVALAGTVVMICLGTVYAWSTFNRPIQSLFPAEPTHSAFYTSCTGSVVIPRNAIPLFSYTWLISITSCAAKLAQQTPPL